MGAILLLALCAMVLAQDEVCAKAGPSARKYLMPNGQMSMLADGERFILNGRGEAVGWLRVQDSAGRWWEINSVYLEPCGQQQQTSQWSQQSQQQTQWSQPSQATQPRPILVGEITEEQQPSRTSGGDSRWVSDNWEDEEVTACARGDYPGTIMFARLVLSSFPGMTMGRTFGCTYMNPTRNAFPPYDRGSLSDHASGAAVDIMLPRIGDPSGRTLADWAVKNFDTLGVKYVIYNRLINSGSGWTDYGGSSPHTDHVHISLLKKAAQGLQDSDVRPLLLADGHVPGSNVGRGRAPVVPRATTPGRRPATPARHPAAPARRTTARRTTARRRR